MTEERIRGRLLQTITDAGPTFRDILENLASHHGSKHPIATVAGLIEDGTLIKYGDRRGARWGLPKKNKARGG